VDKPLLAVHDTAAREMCKPSFQLLLNSRTRATLHARAACFNEGYALCTHTIAVWSLPHPLHTHTPSSLLISQLDASVTDGGLVCCVAEAAAKALEHKLLLAALLRPPLPSLASGSGGSGVAQEGSNDGGGGGGMEAAVAALEFRARRTPGYEPLPGARVRVAQGGLGLLAQLQVQPEANDDGAVGAAAAIAAVELPPAIIACEAALGGWLATLVWVTAFSLAG
jgi:hypothetical protein